MVLEHWMESLADDLRNDRIDLTEPISDAGHTVADEIIERLSSGAAEITSLRERLADYDKFSRHEVCPTWTGARREREHCTCGLSTLRFPALEESRDD